MGLLKKALYGTRDAPLIWQKEVKATLESLGFRRSILQPSVYIHDSKEIILIIHVDDFLVTGDEQQLQWLKEKLEERYDLRGAIISSRAGDSHETKYLNRRLRWSTDNMMSYEGDGKHVKRLLLEWGLIECVASSSPLTRP